MGSCFGSGPSALAATSNFSPALTRLMILPLVLGHLLTFRALGRRSHVADLFQQTLVRGRMDFTEKHIAAIRRTGRFKLTDAQLENGSLRFLRVGKLQQGPSLMAAFTHVSDTDRQSSRESCWTGGCRDNLSAVRWPAYPPERARGARSESFTPRTACMAVSFSSTLMMNRTASSPDPKPGRGHVKASFRTPGQLSLGDRSSRRPCLSIPVLGSTSC